MKVLPYGKDIIAKNTAKRTPMKKKKSKMKIPFLGFAFLLSSCTYIDTETYKEIQRKRVDGARKVIQDSAQEPDMIYLYIPKGCTPNDYFF